jgi:hypothetical protein
VLAASLAAEGLVLGYGLNHNFTRHLLWTESVALVLFGVALVALVHSRLSGRRALVCIVGIGFGLQLIALTQAPTTSDDAFRYGWDAKVQLAGIDPYRYAPDADVLRPLRTTTLFPDLANCQWQLTNGHCSLVNRPRVHTIYPPVAEAAFAASRLASFGSTDGTFPLQLIGAVGATAISALLAFRVYRERRRVWTVAIWAWCPVTVVEVGNNAHIDWLAVLFSIAGLMAYRRDRPAWAGGLVGAAIATKLYPGLLLVSMLKRHPDRVVGCAVGLVALSYVPHVAAVGTDVIGYLPGYLKEERYTSGGRFMLLDFVLPDVLVKVAAGLVIVLAALWAWRHSSPDAPEETAVVLVGVTLLVTTPSYAWYALLLLGLIAMTGRVEWLPLVGLTTVAMLAAPLWGNGIGMRTLCYGAGLAAVLFGAKYRRRISEWQPS